jgi:sensor histidine kinase regulating citrate/malate metabolism
LSGYLKNGEIEKAEKHIENNIGELSNIINTGNISIDAMLNYYRQRAKENLNIEIYTELSIPPALKLESKHIVTILGNALENAMDACGHVEHDLRYIRLKALITNHNALLINIVNPYLVTPIADKDGNLITTKADKRNHGMGLISISEIMPEDKGQVHYEYADNVFKFMAIFYGVITNNDQQVADGTGQADGEIILPEPDA